MGIQIGVDGGASKTAIVALDPRGRVLRFLLKPASNYHVVGMEQAVRNIIEGINEIMQEETVEGIGITLAGINTPEDWRIMANGLRQKLKVLIQKTTNPYQEVPVVLENDVFGALMSVQGEFSGNVLAVGTGAIALGVNITGDVFRLGGWGYLIGDQGSGYDIGRKALAATVASFDEYGPKSILETMITEHLGLSTVLDISNWLYQRKRTNKEVAALVPVVVEAVGKGDNVSKLILAESGEALGLLTKALLRKTGGLEVGLVGGIGNIWELIEPSFLATVKEEFPSLQIINPRFPPSVGSALLSKISQIRHIEL
ncbi:MAG TPA: BadF/BadG/BcrA/BcrD ATPase family protein [Desulfosporosinus sp.]|nr:BadF/BadG/BcrA/BcrD ATPase family protein [Desulfosporosinus sp.]